MLNPVVVKVMEGVEEIPLGAVTINTGGSSVGATVGATVVVRVLVRGTSHCGPQAQLCRTI